MYQKWGDRMTSYKIPSFTEEKTGLIVKDISCFQDGERVLLFESSGHILIADSSILKMLVNKKIHPHVIRKLVSRGFIVSEAICSQTMCKKIVPEFFMVDMTTHCNMQCRYCLRDVNNCRISISEEILMDICSFIKRYCRECGVRNITVQPWGGEPLLELDKILLMRKLLNIENTKVHFSIETNALLLNERNLHTLYDNKIGIGISIDGFKEVHDSQRVLINGQGTHHLVEENLLRTQTLYGNRLGTITTVTKKNCDYIEEILEYFAIKLHLTNVKFNFVHKSLFSDCSGLCLTKAEISDTVLRILNKLVELNERGYIISEHNIKTKLKNLLFHEYSDICHSCGCHGGRSMIVFDMQGKIYPCELTDTPEESIGSIYEPNCSLNDLVEHASRTKDFYMSKKEDICNSCDWYVFCKGGCTVRTMSIGKRPPHIDEIECSVNLSLYPALIKLILEKPQIVNRFLNEEVCGY